MGREINSSRIDVERNIDFFFERRRTCPPILLSYSFFNFAVTSFTFYSSTIINPFALHIRDTYRTIGVIFGVSFFCFYHQFFFFSTNMVKATRIAGPLFDLSHFSWRRSRSEMVKIIHERVYCYSSSRILERGLKIDSTFNVSKVHPSPFIQTRPSSKLVFDAMLNSDLFSLSLPPRPAHVPPTEIMKSETQGT